MTEGMKKFLQAYDTANSVYFVNIDEIKFIRPCPYGKGAWLVLKGETERSLYVVEEAYANIYKTFILDFPD